MAVTSSSLNDPVSEGYMPAGYHCLHKHVKNFLGLELAWPDCLVWQHRPLDDRRVERYRQRSFACKWLTKYFAQFDFFLNEI